MKIYISGPITGVENYYSHFEKVEMQIWEMAEVINPAEVNMHLPASTTHEEYMRISIELLRMCDTIIMLDGWEQSKGAVQEFDFAVHHGYNIMFERSLYEKDNETLAVYEAD